MDAATLKIHSYLSFIGELFQFIFKLFKTSLRGSWTLRSLTDQIWKITIDSSLIIIISGVFVGAIMTLQFGLQMKMFDALALLGGISTSGTIREVGPLLIAFLLSGKVGAYTAAEVGAMKVNDQIDAIRCLGIDPFEVFLVPRWIGIILSSFVLLLFGLLASVLGGMTIGLFYFDITPLQFMLKIPEFVSLPSILSGAFKCFTFAFWLASISLFFGFTASGGAKGVGRAVLNTAVLTMVTIVIADWLTSQIWVQIVSVL